MAAQRMDQLACALRTMRMVIRTGLTGPDGLMRVNDRFARELKHLAGLVCVSHLKASSSRAVEAVMYKHRQRYVAHDACLDADDAWLEVHDVTGSEYAFWASIIGWIEMHIPPATNRPSWDFVETPVGWIETPIPAATWAHEDLDSDLSWEQELTMMNSHEVEKEGVDTLDAQTPDAW